MTLLIGQVRWHARLIQAMEIIALVTILHLMRSSPIV